MRPVLFKFFTIPIYGYGAMVAIGILAALTLLNSRVRKNKKGNTFALYIIIYSIGRIIVEVFRVEPRGTVSILSTS